MRLVRWEAPAKRQHQSGSVGETVYGTADPCGGTGAKITGTPRRMRGARDDESPSRSHHRYRVSMRTTHLVRRSVSPTRRQGCGARLGGATRADGACARPRNRVHDGRATPAHCAMREGTLLSFPAVLWAKSGERRPGNRPERDPNVSDPDGGAPEYRSRIRYGLRMEEPVPVTSVTNRFEADMVCDLLRTAGLECGMTRTASDSAFAGVLAGQITHPRAPVRPRGRARGPRWGRLPLVGQPRARRPRRQRCHGRCHCASVCTSDRTSSDCDSPSSASPV